MRYLVTFFISAFLFVSNSEAADYYWEYGGQRGPDPLAICKSVFNASYNSGFYIDTPINIAGRFAYCNFNEAYWGPPGTNRSIPIFLVGDACPQYTKMDTNTGICKPDPQNCPPGTVSANGGTICTEPPMCPSGSYWDFESERCAYPEDDLCPTGSNWDPSVKDCVCDGDGVLSNANGLKLCFPPAKDECTTDSADFLGYLNNKPVCAGRARCANGFVPGYIGDEAVCIPEPGKKTDDCEGTQGKLNGKDVCIPSFGKDESCPTGKGGTVNGQHVCQEDPKNDPRCKPGETSGYVGRGSEMVHTCVPANYKPDTCPPGQYSLNIKDGFACVYAKPKPTETCKDNPDTPDNECEQKIKGSIVSKDASGNVTGKQEIELKFPEDGLEVKVNGLLQDQPNDDYYEKLLDHSETQLAQMDEATQKVLEDFRGDDGAFTERGKLDAAGNYLLGMFGYSTSCSGSLLFYVSKTGQRIEATCAQLERLKRLFGWFIYVTTALGIWGVLMRKQED